MSKKALKTLEYDKIIDRLSEYTVTPGGKEMCRQLIPSTNYSEIELWQTNTEDALLRIYKKGSLSFRGVKDIRGSLAALELGSSLSAAELLNTASLLETALRVKNEENPEKTDSLSEYFSSISPLSPLCKEIRRCIISPEEIADDASPGIKNVRRQMRNSNEKIHAQLNSLINSSGVRSMLMDTLITMRDNRYCLPVKAEYKSSFPGMVHDQSSSGSTLFIEPASVVKLNNELRELSIKEQEEIEKLLAGLSQEAAEHLEELNENYRVLCLLDFIFSKAMLAKDMNAVRPLYNHDRYIDIKKGRHPLVDKKRVVPIDVNLGKDFHLLVITGPNTGGKTVTLKTIGLFTLMGQAGLHIPALEHSQLSVFNDVYADIGDEQSIEQSLSTFSSHMTNTVKILEKADKNSLCLFDELGAGTDPTEGAALAMAILSSLHNRGIRTAATTHYSELKLFALSTNGVENACCEFDVATLMPTYRLLIGIPGKSNAFAISKKLGLPDSIIEDARGRIDTESKTFEDVISDLDKTRLTLEKEEKELARYKSETEELKRKLKEKTERLDSSKDKILNKANEEAREILEKAKQYADETIKKYNKWGSDKGIVSEMERERTKLREKINEKGSKIAERDKKKTSGKLDAKSLHIGDGVRIISLNATGTVSTLPDNRGRLYVQTGILKSQVNISDLELVAEDTLTLEGGSVNKKGRHSQKPSSGYQNIKLGKSENVHMELNLIGKTVDEAIPILDKYLDDAYLARLGKVNIIHGFGTGALKNAVHNHLKRMSYVKCYYLEEMNRGSTVVEFNT